MSPTTNAIEPRLALWGAFDVDDFAAHLAPSIFAHEMQRRLGHLEVRVFAPLGYLHPLPLDGGFLVEPLGEWSPKRITELTREADLVAIGDGGIIHTRDDTYASFYDTSVEEARRLQPSRFFIEGLGPTLEESNLVAWHAVGIPFEFDQSTAARVRDAARKKAYIAVHDELSRDRLLRAGVEREIAVVPDVAFLAGRIFPIDVLDRRLAYLRGVDAYPLSQRPIVVQGSRALLPSIDQIAAGLAAIADTDGAPILLLETGTVHGDREFTDALAARLRGVVHRMPASPTVPDIVAAITHARCFLGDSLVGNAIAFAHDLPASVLDLSGPNPALAEFAALIGGEAALVRTPADLLAALRRPSGTPAMSGFAEIASRVDAHFDALGALVERAAPMRRESRHAGAGLTPTAAVPLPGDDPAALRRGFNARGRRLVEQRLRLADEIERKDAEIERKDAEIERKGAEIERLEAVVRGLLDSKWFRYTAPLRAIVRKRGPNQ